MAWRVANSLLTARGELDALYPRRPKTGQEGTIGNTQHVAEGWTASDHNPWVTLNGIGVVRAWDIDCTATAAQIATGLAHDPNALAEHLAAIQRARFRAFGTRGYVIWNRRITTSGSPGGVWQTYRGSDPHDRHIHVSVGVNPSEFDDAEPWHLATAFGRATAGGNAVPLQPSAPTDTTTTAPTVQEDDDMTVLIFAPHRGYASDVNGFSLIGDQASVDAMKAQGVKQLDVTDLDFDRMRRTDAAGLVFFNGTRGYAVQLAGQAAHGVAKQTDVDQYKAAGFPQIDLSDAEFAHVLGE